MSSGLGSFILFLKILLISLKVVKLKLKVVHISIVCCGVGLEFALRNRVLLWWCLKIRVLLWTVLIDSSLVWLTILILIEIIALEMILIVVLIILLRKIPVDASGYTYFRDCFERGSRSNERIFHIVKRFFESVNAYV
nr:hypothetical protein [Tanacetum cinerariifolium]